jgi:hypothetical protein
LDKLPLGGYAGVGQTPINAKLARLLDGGGLSGGAGAKAQKGPRSPKDPGLLLCSELLRLLPNTSAHPPKCVTWGMRRHVTDASIAFNSDRGPAFAGRVSDAKGMNRSSLRGSAHFYMRPSMQKNTSRTLMAGAPEGYPGPAGPVEIPTSLAPYLPPPRSGTPDPATHKDAPRSLAGPGSPPAALRPSGARRDATRTPGRPRRSPCGSRRPRGQSPRQA